MERVFYVLYLSYTEYEVHRVKYEKHAVYYKVVHTYLSVNTCLL
jgi:hypothetical protein